VERRNWQVTVIDQAARAVRATTVGASPNTTASIPIELIAQGDEHSLSFSLTFDPAVLGNPRAEVGADASGATLTANSTEAAMGRFGITLVLPAGQRFLPGNRQIAVVSFSVASGTGATSTMVGFGNQPVTQQVADSNATALSATWAPGLVAINTRTVVNVSAATFKGAVLARESIAVAFGSELAGSTESATTLPLPTSLGGVTVKVKDSASVEHTAPLFFVSPGQINYLIPEGTANGSATVTFTGSNYTAVGVIEIASTAPGVFAANADGRGVPAALALRIAADGSQRYEPAFDYDGAKFVARLLDLGPESDQLILVLFGTGLRHYKSRSAITVNIGGIDSEVLYVGPQGGFVGLDQINVRIPRRLLQRGEVDVMLMVDGQSANVVKINVF
jgi:uncharacterized protein (TIGR03437 family)